MELNWKGSDWMILSCVCLIWSLSINTQSNLQYKSHQTTKPKYVSYRLAVFVAQSVEARRYVANEDVDGAAPTGANDWHPISANSRNQLKCSGGNWLAGASNSPTQPPKTQASERTIIVTTDHLHIMFIFDRCRRSGDTWQIWTWFKVSNLHFRQVIFSRKGWIYEGILGNPHPSAETRWPSG